MLVFYNEKQFTIKNYSYLKVLLTNRVGVTGAKYFDYFVFMVQKLESSLDLLKELDLVRTLEDLYLYAPYPIHKLRELVKEKYLEKYRESSGKSPKAITMEAVKIFTEIVDNWESQNNSIYERKEIDSYLANYKEALSLSSSGRELVLDVSKFIPLHLSHAQALESRWYNYHKAVVDNLNAFFNYVPITEKRLKELFTIDSSGRIEIKPESVSMKVYKNYIG